MFVSLQTFGSVDIFQLAKSFIHKFSQNIWLWHIDLKSELYLSQLIAEYLNYLQALLVRSYTVLMDRVCCFDYDHLRVSMHFVYIYTVNFQSHNHPHFSILEHFSSSVSFVDGYKTRCLLSTTIWKYTKTLTEHFQRLCFTTLFVFQTNIFSFIFP